MAASPSTKASCTSCARQPLRDPTWNYVVLAAAAVFESGSFAIALRQFLRSNRGSPFWRAIRSSKDPTTYTVLAEDAAALAGLAVAAVGVYLSHRLDCPHRRRRFDRDRPACSQALPCC